METPVDKSFSQQVLELCEFVQSRTVKSSVLGAIAKGLVLTLGEENEWVRKLRDLTQSEAEKDSTALSLAQQVEATLKNKPLAYLNREAPRVGHHHYDQLIEELFTKTKTGIPREVFLEEVLSGLARLGQESEAEALFVLEADRDHEGIARYRGVANRGVHAGRWANFCKESLSRAGSSFFLEQVLFGRRNLQVLHSFYLPDYADEFRGVIESKFLWINAVALPSSAPHAPERALFILYPASQPRGGELRVPTSALQEWRVLHFAALAYQHLEHQLAGLAEQVAARRAALLNELAPGILHHEMGACLSLMRANLRDQVNTLDRLLADYDDPLLDLLMQDEQALLSSAARLYATVDTFNNLEQRRGRERVRLADLAEQLRLMCYHRLGAAGVQLDYKEEQPPLPDLHTDAALLLHLMLNIVMNAVNAIHESPEPVDGKHIRLAARRLEPAGFELRFLNSGPPVASAIRGHLFQRGVTNRPAGHGQGLYICRLIAQYLGGGLSLMEEADLEPGFRVGFRFELPIHQPEYGDLESERRRR